MSLSEKKADSAGADEILGYLNFSAGASDPRFLRALDDLWKHLGAAGILEADHCAAAKDWLLGKLDRLTHTNPAFRDADQARGAVHLVFAELLSAYRAHHKDLLFHQSEGSLFNAFFVGRAAEAVLAAGGPWDERERIVKTSLERLNDFLGHRPLPVLENHRHEPYGHERARPVPLFIAGVGVAVGKYQDLIEQTLAILRQTDPDLLAAAWFDLDALLELSFDPRAYDFNHPANHRPNYHFGTWDQHLIDNRGRYRRFVIQQCTLDAVLSRIEQTSMLSRDELLFEAGAVLAGTILMASGTTGGGPETHDSSVTLATLLPHIARYRDEFYQQLLAKTPGEHRRRLEAEAAAMRQPFAAARQHLNAQLSRLRALQLQHVQLALVFARLGFSDAATRQAQIVPAASARLVCQMQCLLTTGHRWCDAGRLDECLETLAEVEDLLTRAIECGAVVDPWNILGFGGQFSLFPAIENSIPDPRVDELFDLVEQIFALYARLWQESAIAGRAELEERVAAAFGKRATWWDHYATSAVGGLRHVSGIEATDSAKHVAAALAAWHKAGSAAATITFWRPYAESFDSPRAYGRVVEILLDKPDLAAAMALLMQWLSQAETVRLDEGNRSFYALAIRWLHTALNGAADASLVAKFFDYLEVNADTFSEVPSWQPGELAPDDISSGRLAAGADEAEDEEGEDLYGAAYEDVVYRDSTADGIDADMLEARGANIASEDELDRELKRLSPRLAFLAMLAAMWKMAAEKQKADLVPGEWLGRGREITRGLAKLAADIQGYQISASSVNYDALVDYDRRRIVREALLEKVAATMVAVSDAELTLAATTSRGAGLGDAADSPSGARKRKAGKHRDDSKLLAIYSAILTGDREAVARQWGAFLAEAAEKALLYVPLSRGGDARKVAAVRGVQQTLRELLRRLPRMGMLRETCQLLRACRAMEKKHSPGAGAVTEFDRLFEAGYSAIVDCLVESSRAGRKKQKAEGRRQKTESEADAQLIDCLEQVTESLLNEWLSHSRTLRLSVLERVASPKEWQELVNFIQRCGHDLFTQQFFHLGNLRAILHQGVDVWLDKLLEDEEVVEQHLVLRDLDRGLSRAEAKKHLALVVEAVAENYAEYRDYNTTTTQSDRGEMLYLLLDFLRIKVAYERIHWNLRPAMMAHDVLVRRGAVGAAEIWRRAMQERTAETADKLLAQLAELQTKAGMRLASVADRLQERFVRPLATDRLRALVRPAAEEARGREAGAASVGHGSAFALLEREAGQLASEPCGAGLELPDWLEALEEEADRVAGTHQGWDPASADSLDDFPRTVLTWEEIESQLSDWDESLDVN
jgi:hypothetical protein